MPEWVKIILRPIYFRVRHWRGNQGVKIHEFTIDGILREYGSVYTFVLNAASPPEFIAGQYGHVIAPGAIIDNHHVQHISFANAPHEGCFLISMDLASGSRFKRKFKKAVIGDRLGIYAIKGDFVLKEADWERPVLLIAGGIGIAPVRSLAADFLSKGKSNWSLVYAGKGYLYQDFWSRVTDKVSFVKRDTLLPAIEAALKKEPEALIYLCGAGGFVRDVKQYLGQAGIDPASIHTEDFSY
ncbi:ferredoxin--NADP reductase [Sneathiella sp.]|uniref:ferredoxin--NADP reductase n=1 Tax=Sneathiella sp. TaxID=1964365 RepID=UPI0026242949|nr:FAD-dependent oxidoreductase [Sneathiella sp.]MDF2368650.1 FAD-dependent oxidoreductase [Sneathiella sp.]